MSAYICSDKHIAAIAWTAARQHGPGSPRIDLNEYIDNFKKLYEANVQSVNYRYNETTDTACEASQIPTARKDKKWQLTNYNEVQVMKLCHCWEYQSSELPNYEITKGYEVMQRALKNASQRLPGYDDAEWEV